MTAVLQLLQDIARHLDVKTTVTPEQLRDLMKKTDLQRPDEQDGGVVRTGHGYGGQYHQGGCEILDGCGVMTSSPARDGIPFVV